MQKNTPFIDPENFKKLKEYLDTDPKLIILTHANPDGDAIGSALSLHLGLKGGGFKSSVACLDSVPKTFRFLAHTDDFLTDFDENAFDAVIFLDCGDKKMTRFHDAKPRILSDKIFKINIDHHPSNDNFGNINFVVTHACSSAEIVFRLLQQLDIPITPQMATALLLGVYTDTGSFMHQNTTPQSYATAAELVRLGGNVSQIARNIFHSNEFRTFKLWGKVLNNLHLTEDGAAIIGVHKKDYESIGASRGDLAGVIDLINSMPEAEYSVVLSEDEKGNVKASLRTRKPDVDMKALAEKFGGGGHIKASGFTIPHGKLKKEIKWKIVQE